MSTKHWHWENLYLCERASLEIFEFSYSKTAICTIFCWYFRYFVGTNDMLVGLSYSHTIATTSRRPLTTTFFWVVAGGCQRSANVCRWSPTSRRLVVRELHRQPLADLRQPLFWGCFSEEFGGRQMIVDDRRPVGDWSAIGCQNSWSVRGFRCSIENLSPTKLLERLQSTGRGSELKWCGHFQHTLFTSDSRDHKLEKTGGVHSLECQPVHACCLCTS